jgi:polynucleotide 5'-kinase involved in rRNA processing
MKNTALERCSVLGECLGTHCSCVHFLGPPYTHQRKPQRMVYYGKMNCYNDYENYIDIVKYVFRDYKREFPLIINTMGWVSGKTCTHVQLP